MFSALATWEMKSMIALCIFMIILFITILWQIHRRSKRIDREHTPTVWQVSTSPVFDTEIKPNPSCIPARMYPLTIPYDPIEDTFEDTIDDDHFERSKFLADTGELTSRVAETIDSANESYESTKNE